MSVSVYAVTTSVYATVTVHDQDAIDRITGPGGDEWRSQFYGTIVTAEDVVGHFAFNAITNGVHDVSRLDGWADLASDAVTIEIDDTDAYAERVPGVDAA